MTERFDRVRVAKASNMPTSCSRGSPLLPAPPHEASVPRRINTAAEVDANTDVHARTVEHKTVVEPG